MAGPDGLTLPQWLSAAVLDQRQRAEFLRTLAAAMPDGQALLDLADWIDRDVDAKWAILELYATAAESREIATDAWVMLRDVVRHLATVYADRDGYDESWRP